MPAYVGIAFSTFAGKMPLSSSTAYSKCLSYQKSSGTWRVNSLNTVGGGR
jgi:hypothetical protein